MSRIAAITGAASGIGQAACRRLLEAGWTVFGLDNARERLTAAASGFDLVSGSFPADQLRRGGRRAGHVGVPGNWPGPERAGDLRRCASHIADGGHGDRGLRPRPQRQHPRHVPLRAESIAAVARRRHAGHSLPLRAVVIGRGIAAKYRQRRCCMPRRKPPPSASCAASWPPSGRRPVCAGQPLLAPGTVDTPMVAAVADPSASKGYRPSGVSPVGRIARPDDVVDVMMFLLSDAARYVTGTTIPVDGGTQAAFIPPGSNR